MFLYGAPQAVFQGLFTPVTGGSRGDVQRRAHGGVKLASFHKRGERRLEFFKNVHP